MKRYRFSRLSAAAVKVKNKSAEQMQIEHYKAGLTLSETSTM